MQSNETRDESRGNGFKIAFEFGEGNIASQIHLVNAFEGTQENAHVGPKPFRRVDVNFTDAIVIIVSCPFVGAVTNDRTRTQHMIVALVFVRVEMRTSLGKAVNVRCQGSTSGVHHDPHPHLTALSTNGANDRRTVIGVSAPSAPLVGASTGRIQWVAMRLPFFPPHSETFHQFPSAGRRVASRVVPVGH